MWHTSQRFSVMGFMLNSSTSPSSWYICSSKLSIWKNFKPINILCRTSKPWKITQVPLESYTVSRGGFWSRELWDVSLWSVLGPLLYVLYTSEIYSRIHQFGLKVHGYADDLQIYGHTILEEADALAARVSACIEEVKRWMTSNRLCLNPSKTELIWFG